MPQLTNLYTSDELEEVYNNERQDFSLSRNEFLVIQMALEFRKKLVFKNELLDATAINLIDRLSKIIKNS